MTLYKITSNNFQLIGKSLQINIPDNIMVMFKQQGCVGCNAAEPAFSQLANSNRRVSYGVIDLTNDKQIISWSRGSTTPIEKVPMFVLYVQGRPHAKFKGTSKTLETLDNFLMGALSTVQQQQVVYTTPPNINNQPSQFVNPNLYGGHNHIEPQLPPQQQSRNDSRNSGPGMPSVHPSMQNQCAEDDEDCLMKLSGIYAKNMPWDVAINKMEKY